MEFWTQPGTEPKRKFRWLLYFAGAPQFIIKSVTKPSFQVGSSSHNFLQHQFHFPGRVTWQDISVTLVDPVNPDATRTFYEIIKSAGYLVPSEFNEQNTGSFKTVSKKEMVQNLGTFIRIDQIAAEGSNKIIESWKINNPQITSVNFDSLDYGVDEALNIQVGIKYDWAELNPDDMQNAANIPWNYNTTPRNAT
tara:strand:+ start:889 stop:1470 length:582 start_codon:yes stop_codon:yes gene_type:complete